MTRGRSVSTEGASRYRILSDVGRGGMGRVCLAQDTALGRNVALKFLTATADDQSARRRLLREAQAAARLDHPFICKVYEVGERGGEPFIAMEYVEGETLKDRLKTGPLPLADALRLGAEIAEALDCAQAHGIVHRDLKPANVMLTRDGHVKVMDFGIAARAPSETASGTESTVTWTPLAGTPAYMSPEQLRGRPVDSRSDIFAFGLVLYEMLTGRHPFASDSPLATAEAVLHEPAPPLARHLPNPPPLLEHVTARLLAREKDNRFQTFRDVRNELLSIASPDHAPVAAGGWIGRAWRRRPARAALAAVAVVACAAAVWLAVAWFNRPALAFSARDWILIADVDNQTGDPVFDRSLSTALNVDLSQSQYVNVLPRGRVRQALLRMQRPAAGPLTETLASEVALREGAKAVLACSIAQVGTVYELTARLIDPQTHTPVLSDAARAERKDDVLPALDDLATRVRRHLGESLGALSRQHRPLPKVTTASLDALKLYADAGRAPDSDTKDRLLEQAVALDPDFALAHAQLGFDYYLEPDRADRLTGEAHLTKALGLLDRLTFRERLIIAALAEDARGRRDAAATAYKAYLTAYPDDADVWFRLGWTYMAALRQYASAADAFKRAIAINPNESASLVNLATSYLGLGQYQQARDAYERAFAIRPAAMFGSFVNLEYGFTLVRLGEPDQAAGVFTKMIAQSDPGLRAHGYRSRGLLEMYQGQYAAAAESFTTAIAIDHAHELAVSEFRDRIFLAAALEGRGQRRALGDDMDRIRSLAARMRLGPEWLRLAVKLFARNGRLAEAQAMLDELTKTIGDPTSDSTTNRNTRLDQANADVARAEVDLARGRTADALELLEAAAPVDSDNSDTTDSLAAAYLKSGRLTDAARCYEQLIAAESLDTEAQPYWFEAHLQLARIRVRQGNPDAARALYERVLEIWKQGDTDLIPLRAARSGLAALSGQ